MFNNFKDIENVVHLNGRRITTAVAGSHDSYVPEAVAKAREKGSLKAVLIGYQVETEHLFKDMGYTGQNMGFMFADMNGDEAVATYAYDTVVQKKVDIPMKGIINTASFVRVTLNKGRGFVPANALISQLTSFEWQGRFMILTDCAVNIASGYDDKVKIIRNAAALVKKMGIDCPKVAVPASVEVVNPKTESSVHVAMLTMVSKRGQIKERIIDGPLALDNAVPEDAARRKGINSEVAGHADILVVPDLDAGNMLTKSLTLFAGLKTAGAVDRTRIPVIMRSRTDSTDDKYHTVLAALMQLICD